MLARTLEATHFALMCSGFAFASCLGTLIMRTSASFGQNASLLDFTIKFFQRNFKGIARIDLYFTHRITSAICYYECRRSDLRSVPDSNRCNRLVYRHGA
jgi:hypothetical protein